MKINNNLNYLCDHVLKPWSKHYTPNEKKVSWAATVTFGALSLGLLQAGALIVKGALLLTKKCLKTRPSAAKSNSVFKKTTLQPKSSSLKKLSGDIEKNIKKEFKLDQKRAALRVEVENSPSIDPEKIKKIVNLTAQLTRVIEKTETLQTNKNQILKDLNLPTEKSPKHPLLIDLPILLKTFVSINQEIMKELEQSDPDKKSEIWKQLQSLRDEISKIGKAFTETKELLDNGKNYEGYQQIELIRIQLNKLIQKTSNIS